MSFIPCDIVMIISIEKFIFQMIMIEISPKSVFKKIGLSHSVRVRVHRYMQGTFRSTRYVFKCEIEFY